MTGRIIKVVVCACAVSGLGACNIVLEPSNNPDSGVVCSRSSADAGRGSATLTGERSFTVNSAYQGRQAALSNDGTSMASLWFGLYQDGFQCGRSDAGPLDRGELGSPVLAGYLNDPGRDLFPPGPYEVTNAESDGGRRATLYLLTNSSDGGVQTAVGITGTVTLTSLADCSLSGNFNSTFHTSDGGRTSLSGSFSSTYCQ